MIKGSGAVNTRVAYKVRESKSVLEAISPKTRSKKDLKNEFKVSTGR